MMHGLMNRAIQCFVCDNYGQEVWLDVTRQAGLELESFEAMLTYDDDLTRQVLKAAAERLRKPEEEVLEDIGTYLVSHSNTEALRRLLRFGGVTFEEFLHSLDDLPERARLAVEDLDLPRLELRQHSPDRFSLFCHGGPAGFGHAMMGILRTLADDYGALAFLEFQFGQKGLNGGQEVIQITLAEPAYTQGRSFDLGARAG